MRILYLNHNVAGTGTYQRALNIAIEAVRRGHNATLVTTSRDRMLRSESRTIDGVDVIEAPDMMRGGARNGWDIWNTTWRSNRLARSRFDLIHAFDSRPVVILPALATHARTGAPLFLDWADWWGRGGAIKERSGWPVRTFFGPVETWFEEAFRNRATANTVISDRLRDRCVKLGVPSERVFTMPNGCTPPRAYSSRDRDGARNDLGLNGAPLFVHVGAMHRADAAMLFTAFGLIRESLPLSRLVLIGNPRIPANLSYLPGVSRTGFITSAELEHWLAAADIGIVVLRDNIASHARWPGKINDYFSAGVPVAIPRVGEAAEYVERYGAGRTSAPTAESLAATMIEMVSDRAMLERARESALQLAGTVLSWSRVTDGLFDFYGRWCPDGTADATDVRMVGVS